MVRRVAVRTPDGLVINPGVLTSQMNGDDHEVNTGRIIAECSWKLIKRHPKLAYPFVWSSSTSGNKADWLIENQKGKQVYVSCKSNAEIIGSLYPKWAFDVCCWFPFHPDKN